MDIIKIRRKRTTVAITYRSGEEQHTVSSNEAPLATFDAAVAALAPLVLSILHLPADYGVGLKATGLTLVDKQGSKQVVLTATKDIPEASGVFNIATPLRFMEHPETEGTYTPALTEAEVDLVDSAVEAAKEYVRGERQQGVLLDQVAKDADAAAEEQQALLGEGAAGQEQAPPLSAEEQAAADAIKAANAAVKPKRKRRKIPSAEQLRNEA